MNVWVGEVRMRINGLLVDDSRRFVWAQDPSVDEVKAAVADLFKGQEWVWESTDRMTGAGDTHVFSREKAWCHKLETAHVCVTQEEVR